MRELFDKMQTNMGDQHWWPQERWMETIVGSILIQNASSVTVDPVIQHVGEVTAFDPEALQALSQEELENLIKAAGLYRSKAKYLRNALDFFAEYDFDVANFATIETPTLRKLVNAIPGIGNETADVWLVYIFGRPQFIADSYSRRLFTYLGISDSKLNYGKLKKYIETQTDFAEFDINNAREWHALIDEFGKLYLRSPETFQQSWLARSELSPELLARYQQK
ncbi:DNA repair protein [Periweissella cryptocerci]|uniref:DNA repair protein n=2 Tax=Periweissella cryptocerci TaxID=2506420 RepID=A0A4P6YXE0_9LACO|nr:DNA repair protein [Periweissella cryptocerci]